MGWIKTNKEYKLADHIEHLDGLPKGTYYVRFDEMSGFYLEKVKDFVLPQKVYGDTSIVQRWLTSYHTTRKNTGVILSGLKGSGKTLLAKQLAIQSGLPIIIIDKPFSSSDFISFITNPDFGDACIFIDEFEKIFSSDKKVDITPILSILDGAFDSHNLFIFTCNHMYQCSYLTNRPSRIRYRKHFDSLEETIIDEVIQDLLVNKEHSESLKIAVDKIGIVTFDLLITIINEMNLFNESAIEVLKHLNVDSEEIYVTFYEIWKKEFVPTRTSTYLKLGDEISVRRSESSNDSEYNRLDTWVDLDTSQAVRLNKNEWKLKNLEGEFIMRKQSAVKLLF